MIRASSGLWTSLERRSPTLFLVAGALLVGYAALNGIAAFGDAAYVTVEDVVGPAGLATGFVGLLGLYPTLANGSPRLAAAGAACGALGAVGFSAIILEGLAALAGFELPGWTAVFVLLATLGMLAGYLPMGLAALRADARSRTVGLLLPVPAVVFAAMLSQAILFARFGLFSEATMAWSAFAISSGQALAHLAIGHTLRTDRSVIGREVPSADPSAS